MILGDIVQVEPQPFFDLRPPSRGRPIGAEFGIGDLDAVFGPMPREDRVEVFDVVGVIPPGEQQAAAGREREDRARGGFGEHQAAPRRAEDRDRPAVVEGEDPSGSLGEAQRRSGVDGRGFEGFDAAADTFCPRHPELVLRIEGDGAERRPSFDRRHGARVFEPHEAGGRRGRQFAVGGLGKRGDPPGRGSRREQHDCAHALKVDPRDRARVRGHQELFVDAFGVELGGSESADPAHRGLEGAEQWDAPLRSAAERGEPFELPARPDDQHLTRVL
jgi:hypothetical protein